MWVIRHISNAAKVHQVLNILWFVFSSSPIFNKMNLGDILRSEREKEMMSSYTTHDHGIVERVLASLGKGFDLTSDFRLKYCKGKRRLVSLNDADKRELAVPGFRSIPDVSADIKCDKGDRTRYQTDMFSFSQMSECFNQKSSVSGKIPSGLFNAMFGFDSGSWASDAANIKCLGVDGYFIIFFNVHIDRYPLVLADEVRDSVPSSWDPLVISRYVICTQFNVLLNHYKNV